MRVTFRCAVYGWVHFPSESGINCAFSAEPLSGACLEWFENCRSFRCQFINGGIEPDQLNAVDVGCEE